MRDDDVREGDVREARFTVRGRGRLNGKDGFLVETLRFFGVVRHDFVAASRLIERANP